MARIAETSREEIRQRVDIVELVREYVPALKQAGRNYKACCPFHQEKTPSFTVTPDKQIFHCFGCQAGGDAFSFLMRVEGLSYPEAVKRLGERVGVRVEQPEDDDPRLKELSRLRAALEFARDFYHETLKRSPEADKARRYLAGRGVGSAQAERFKLGYAPGSSTLLAAAARKGFDAETLAKAGLAAPSKVAGRFRDYFWGRILYPIVNPRGETVGFGARTLDGSEPKYLNSPETPLFSKGRVLYGFHEGAAEVRRARRIVLLEGYMDVIALHKHGFADSAAPLGTALTKEHAEFLKTRVEKALLVFDPDSAGSAAALRGAEILLEQGIDVRIATVPEGLDPDELLEKGGPAAFSACLEAAVDLPAFKTEVLLGQDGELSPQRKSKVVGEVLAVIRRSPDDVLKREWVRRLAERLKADEEALYLELRKEKDRPAPRPARSAAPAEPVVLAAAERDALLYVFRQPELALRADIVDEDVFSGPGLGIFQGIKRALAEAPSAWSAKLVSELPEAEAALARTVFCDQRPVSDPEKELAKLVKRLRSERRLRELDAIVKKGAPPAPVFEEYQKVLRELKGKRKGE